MHNALTIFITLFPPKVIAKTTIKLLDYLATKTENKVDDQVMAAIKDALKEE